MGLYGHSFGGLETGYLISGSPRFVAAIAACGYYNFTSDAGSIMDYLGISREASSGLHMGGTLWEKKNEYIKNSPLFYLDQVTMPVLVMTGEKDNQVPHDQSIELFYGLRRLGKRSWMLNYEDATHFIINKRDVDDFTVRCKQYYDHYLKEEPAPKWMTEGIAASKEGALLGYELDADGSCGVDCKVCQYWNSRQDNKTKN
jgi:dipeptidyl aminopeptidase/acylaminoacyl peptidase